MKTEYKNIQIVRIIEGAQVDGVLKTPIPCKNDFFIDAFWMPIRRQIGKKLVLSLQSDLTTFSLICNQAAFGNDGDFESDEEQARFIEEANKVFDVAMYHIDRIMEHFNCKAPHDDVVPFIDGIRPIASIEDGTITLNGRLPMQEAYFLEKYWRPIADQYHREQKGIRFKIHFSDLSTKISVTAELCRYDAICAKKGLPKRDAKKEVNYQIQLILCDLTDAIMEAEAEYSKACKNRYAKKS